MIGHQAGTSPSATSPDAERQADARAREMGRWSIRVHQLFADIRARRERRPDEGGVDRLELLLLSTVQEWGTWVESRDRYTRGHCDRVAEYVSALAGAFGFDEERLFWIGLGAFLHDIGKHVVPAEILNKRGSLSGKERAIVERHSIAGAEMLSDAGAPEDVIRMVRGHHERWDGTGYPDGLRGANIPLAARILCVADVYDALTNDRAYHRAVDRATALKIMSRDVGRVFDPRAFALFASLGTTIDERARFAAPRRISRAIRPRVLFHDEIEARIVRA
jgi:putative nucleotidyltransferase with HDIG domain